MINMNFNQRIVIHTPHEAWLQSLQKGVWQKPLARNEAKYGHATSLVRYESGARFAEHEHPLGEEILVLEGTFSDENGTFPAGSYLRNPPGYFHTSYSKEGCILLVKLNQFNREDEHPVHVDTNTADWIAGHGNLRVMPLHEFDGESSALVYWPAGEHFLPHVHRGGEEIFVIRGEFIDEHGRYPAGSWIRSPHKSRHDPYVEEDTLIFVKGGHLHP